ncbi:MAG: pilus assembly protein PilP [Gammaproteobacteria bacterium]|nr:pilus assembly protein PilP [Gammaproteobacteria bacterium]
MHSTPRVFITFAMLLMAMAGCSPNTDFSDIEVFMDEVDSRSPGRIDPLPAIVTVPPFSYKAGNKRNPFEPPVLVKRVNREGGRQVMPNRNRVKQFLEQFTVGQLAMVGTLAQGRTQYALVRDVEGGVHRVQSGDYMGSDHGKVQGVTDSGIELIEIVPDGTGGWVERLRTLSLAGGA